MTRFLTVFFIMFALGGYVAHKHVKCDELRATEYRYRQYVLARAFEDCKGQCLSELRQLSDRLVKFDNEVLAHEGCGR